jgi:hypothetical protein
VGVVRWRHQRCQTRHPLPSPPPQGGREQTEFAACADPTSPECALISAIAAQISALSRGSPKNTRDRMAGIGGSKEL